MFNDVISFFLSSNLKASDIWFISTTLLLTALYNYKNKKYNIFVFIEDFMFVLAIGFIMLSVIKHYFFYSDIITKISLGVVVQPISITLSDIVRSKTIHLTFLNFLKKYLNK